MAKSRMPPAEVWSVITGPEELLRHLRARHKLARVRGHRRKLRLLACAAARGVWDALPDDRFRAVVEAAERHADTELPRTALLAARDTATDFRPASLFSLLSASVQVVLSAFGMASPDFNRTREALLLTGAVGASQVGLQQALTALRAAAGLAVAASGERVNDEIRRAAVAHQGRLVRDLFGDPYAEVAFDPAWRTAAVLGLARSIHADAAFDRLPILADALEEAGCGVPAVLDHCRGEAVHARGCWVVDGVLGRGIVWA